MEPACVRVIIADDHAIVREGLDMLLRVDRQIDVVGTAMHFDDVLECLETVPVDVVVLDLNGMAQAPLTMVTRLRREYTRVRLVVFSSCVDLAPEVLQLGVLGYVVKEELTQHLLTAIQAAAVDRRYFSPIVQEYLDRTNTVRAMRGLTPQEQHVLKLLAQGHSTIAIAETLKIDPRTAQNYITILRRKTGCNQRTQLVDWYRRAQVHETP